MCRELTAQPHVWSMYGPVRHHCTQGLFRKRTTLRTDSPNPTTCSVSDIIVGFTPTPNPHSHCSLSDTQKFMGFFRNRTSPRTTSEKNTTYSVSDIIVAFTPTPTPRSLSSLSHTHKFMGFFRNRTSLRTASENPTTYSVSDGLVSFILTPTPRSHYSLLPTHIIDTPTLPTPTLLTFTCTQVLWFLARLTRTRSSGVTTRPDTRLTIFPTRVTQCIRGV